MTPWIRNTIALTRALSRHGDGNLFLGEKGIADLRWTIAFAGKVSGEQ